MNFGRNPILLIIALFFLLFIVLSVINRKSSTSLNDADRVVRTQQALTRVTSAEAKYFKLHGHYAAHVADLIPLSPTLNTDLTDGLVTIQIDAGSGKSYFVDVTSSVVSFTRTFVGGNTTPFAKSCLQLKSAAKKVCTRTTGKIQKSLPGG